MQKRIQISANSSEEALELAVAKFHVSEDYIFVNELENGTYEALLDISLALEGKKYLENILQNIGVDYNIEVRTLNNETEIYYLVDSNQNPLLIGLKGRTLEAIQTLLKNLISSFTNEHIQITLDIGSYRENRKRQLEILATKVAKEVAQTKQSVKLKPMSAYERLVIHQKLSDWRDVYTESEGEGENRAIVVKPNLEK